MKTIEKFIYLLICLIALGACQDKNMIQIEMSIISEGQIAEIATDPMPEKIKSLIKPIEVGDSAYIPNVTIRRTDLLDEQSYNIIIEKDFANKIRATFGTYTYSNLAEDYNRELPELKAGEYISKGGTKTLTDISTYYDPAKEIKYDLMPNSSSDSIVSLIRKAIKEKKINSKKIIIHLKQISGISKPDISIDNDSKLIVWRSINNANFYEIQRKDKDSWLEPGTSISDTFFQPTTNTFYRVRAHSKDKGVSDWSNHIEFRLGKSTAISREAPPRLIGNYYNDIEQIKRYIKYCHTLRVASEINNAYRDQALTFLNNSINTIDSKLKIDPNCNECIYWKAAAIELLGYFYKDIENYWESSRNLTEAWFLYRQVIKNSLQWSPYILREIVSNMKEKVDYELIDNLNYTAVSGSPNWLLIVGIHDNNESVSQSINKFNDKFSFQAFNLGKDKRGKVLIGKTYNQIEAAEREKIRLFENGIHSIVIKGNIHWE